MKVTILREAGYEEALRGMAYSYKDRALDPGEWWQGQYQRAQVRAPKLAPKGAGHNKFLRQIQLWVDIEAPRCWWSEFDTYKVGTVAQSESTMHTMAKRAPTFEDFEADTPAAVIIAFMHAWPDIKGDVTRLKLALPEGFLQRRVVTMNYENVRGIVQQRTSHRLRYWKPFIEGLLSQLDHPEFIAAKVEGERA